MEKEMTMDFNPLEEKGRPLEKQVINWDELNVKPYILSRTSTRRRESGPCRETPRTER
jgi:hypothetical protein